MGEENKRVEASLTRGLEALHRLEAKLVFHETPLPSLEESSVECPVSVTLSEHLASLVSQNKDLEETMREMEEDEDEMTRDLEVKENRIKTLEAELETAKKEKEALQEKERALLKWSEVSGATVKENGGGVWVM